MAKAKEHHFDISAKLDMQEMRNAVIQAQKEIETRYDFKGITKEITLNEAAKSIILISASDNKVEAIYDVLISKMNKRGISINSLEELKKEDSSGGNRKYSYKIVDT
ncbi:MAG: YajQ family cyclic di-GMP-binding protein, partial [Deltaproteobacteria bacterium HGW-Deltaproteobacteria-24]